MQSDKVKTVNAYLQHIGLPTVGKVCLTFKQLHTMRYTQSTQQ